MLALEGVDLEPPPPAQQSFGFWDVCSSPWNTGYSPRLLDDSQTQVVWLARPAVAPYLRQPSVSRDRIRVGIEAAPLGRLLVSWIVTGNDRARALTSIG
jgi:hypothetical protein